MTQYGPGTPPPAPPWGPPPGPYRVGVPARPPRFGPYSAPAVRWGIPDSVVVLAVCVAVVVGLRALTPVLQRVGGDPDALSFRATLGLEAIAVAAVVAVVRLRGSGSPTRDLGLRFRWWDLLIGPGVAIAAKIVGAIVTAIVVLALRLPLTGLQSNLPLDRSSGWSWALVVGLAIVAAPFAEELVFRGLVLHAIQNAILRGSRRRIVQPASAERRATAAIVAVTLSSVLFAAAHLYEATSVTMAVALGVQVLVIGASHGVLVVVTKRLGPGMLAHATTNGLSVLLIVLFPHLGTTAG